MMTERERDAVRAMWALESHNGSLFIGPANTSNDYAISRKTAEVLKKDGLIEIRDYRGPGDYEIAALTDAGREWIEGNKEEASR